MAKRDILEDNYNEIIKYLSNLDISKEKLEKLKSQFKDEIASVRRYENINTVTELIKILEIRCIMSFDNIGKIYDIVANLEDKHKNHLGRRLNQQSMWISKSPPATVNLSYCDSEIYSNIPEFRLPDSVIELISSNITTSWQKFARALKIIIEKDIDIIEGSASEIKTRKCLQIFIIKAQQQKLKNPCDILLRALENIGRRDIKEGVENLLMLSFKTR